MPPQTNHIQLNLVVLSASGQVPRLWEALGFFWEDFVSRRYIEGRQTLALQKKQLPSMDLMELILMEQDAINEAHPALGRCFSSFC